LRDPLDRPGESDQSLPVMIIVGGMAVALILGCSFVRDTKSIYAPRRRRAWDE
jgi:hypothetical protein